MSPQFHVVFNDLFSTIQNYTWPEETKNESIFTGLFENCRNFYGEEEVSIPEGAATSAPEGVIGQTDTHLELGGNGCLNLKEEKINLDRRNS